METSRTQDITQLRAKLRDTSNTFLNGQRDNELKLRKKWKMK